MKRKRMALICAVTLTALTALPVSGQTVTDVTWEETSGEETAAEAPGAGASGSGIREALKDLSREDVDALVDFARKELEGKELETREEILDALQEGVEKYNQVNGTNFSLPEEEISRAAGVIEKAVNAGLDVDGLLDRAGDIYESMDGDFSEESMEKAIRENSGKIAGTLAKSFFGNILDKVLGFFRGIFRR